MVATQHKPVIGSAKYADRPVSPEMQEELGRADAVLPDELRERFPVVTRGEIKTRYPNQWIVPPPTRVDQSNRLVAGRLMVQTNHPQEFKRLVESFTHDYPRLHPYTDYTGRSPMGENVVHA